MTHTTRREFLSALALASIPSILPASAKSTSSANSSGEPQIYGSIMGPGDTPGSAKLYWPLIDDMAAADERRVQIGLPSIENDLEKFRQGAAIGPYMTPIVKGEDRSMADVYREP
jgi:hypothetical protein